MIKASLVYHTSAALWAEHTPSYLTLSEVLWPGWGGWGGGLGSFPLLSRSLWKLKLFAQGCTAVRNCCWYLNPAAQPPRAQAPNLEGSLGLRKMVGPGCRVWGSLLPTTSLCLLLPAWDHQPRLFCVLVSWLPSPSCWRVAAACYLKCYHEDKVKISYLKLCRIFKMY